MEWPHAVLDHDQILLTFEDGATALLSVEEYVQQYLTETGMFLAPPAPASTESSPIAEGHATDVS